MGKHTLHEYQENDVEAILAEHGRSNGAIAGHTMGNGKTTIGSEVALRGIARLGWKRVLLIALPNTHKQWQNRIELQAGNEVQLPIRVMDGSKDGRANLDLFMKHQPGIFIAGSAYLQDKDWKSVPQVSDSGDPLWKVNKKTGLVVTKDGEPVQVTKSVRTHFFDRFSRKPLDAILFDEVQAIASRKAHGRQTILSIKAGFRLAMSGTWFANRTENQWSIARWVWPGNGPDGEPYVETNFSKWSENWLLREDVVSKSGRAVQNERGGTVKKVTGEKVPGAFAASLPCYIRRGSTEAPPRPLVIRIDPLPAQRAQMMDLEEDLMTWVAGWDGAEMPLVVDVPVTLRLRLRQVAIAELSVSMDPSTEAEVVTFADDAQSAKLAPLRYLLEERWAGQPVGIFTDSKIGAHFVTKRLQKAGKRAMAWTGDLSQREREDLKQSYMRGEFDYLVATIQSAGTGVDGLQTRASKVVWISEADGNPSLNEQALARYFRQGRTLAHGDFEHVRLICADSVDEIALDNLLARAWAMNMALNKGEALVE